MKDNNTSYCDKVVDMIMLHDVKFGTISLNCLYKGNMGKDTFTSMFNVAYLNPMSFFVNVNWDYRMSGRIKKKYGVSNKDDLSYIRGELILRFKQAPYVINYTNNRNKKRENRYFTTPYR